MEFGKLIESIQANDGEKTAAAPPEETDAGKALEAALEKVAASAPQENPSAGDPVDDLMKIASDLAGTEKEAELQHAALLGHAFADSAIGTWAAYDAELSKKASEQGVEVNEQVKEAALRGYHDTVAALNAPNGEKVASDDLEVEALVKQGEAQGYTREQVHAALQDLSTKTAEDQFVMGQQAAVDEVYASAYNEFVKGAAVAATVIDAVRE